MKTQMQFTGPVDVTPELVMALWESMPDIGKSGVAQMFFSRFVSGDLSADAVEAGVKIVMKNNNLSDEAVKAIQKAVANKMKKFGADSVNQEQAARLIESQMGEAAKAVAKTKLAKAFESMNPDDLLAVATEPVAEAMNMVAKEWFLKTPDGQSKLKQIVKAVFDRAFDEMKDETRAAIKELVAPRVEYKIAATKRQIEESVDNIAEQAVG